MAQAWKTVRMFVSTFRDMHAERGYVAAFSPPKVKFALRSTVRDVLTKNEPSIYCIVGASSFAVTPQFIIAERPEDEV